MYHARQETRSLHNNWAASSSLHLLCLASGWCWFPTPAACRTYLSPLKETTSNPGQCPMSVSMMETRPSSATATLQRLSSRPDWDNARHHITFCCEHSSKMQTETCQAVRRPTSEMQSKVLRSSPCLSLTTATFFALSSSWSFCCQNQPGNRHSRVSCVVDLRCPEKAVGTTESVKCQSVCLGH